MFFRVLFLLTTSFLFSACSPTETTTQIPSSLVPTTEGGEDNSGSDGDGESVGSEDGLNNGEGVGSSGGSGDSGTPASAPEQPQAPSPNPNLSCAYNYERLACEIVAESAYIVSFTTGTGNRCPENIPEENLFDGIAFASIGDLGTCVIDASRGPGGLENFDSLGPTQPNIDEPQAEQNQLTSTLALVDACVDAQGIQARFFEQVNSQLTGSVWPGNSQVYTAPSDGTIEVDLSCQRGTFICMGAAPRPTNGLYWGIGLDGTESCADCCLSCGASSTTNLLCQ